MNSLVTLVKPGQNIVTREESWSNENDQGLWSCLVKVKWPGLSGWKQTTSILVIFWLVKREWPGVS